jgi:multidrug efflux pump
VRAAIQAQNTQVSAGQLGGTPASAGQGFTPPSRRRAACRPPEQFGDILLRSNSHGGEVRLRDVARVELGAENYGMVGRFNGKPAAGIGIRLASGANALDTATAVRPGSTR